MKRAAVRAARPPLLFVALVASGLPLGWNPNPGAELPEDITEIESPTAEQAGKPVTEFPGVERWEWR